MKNSFHHPCHTLAKRYYIYIVAFIFIHMFSGSLSAQCIPVKGSLEGVVYTDTDNNGIRNATETGIQGILVQAFRADGSLYGTATTDVTGLYALSGLKDGERIRLVFNFGGGYYPSIMGTNNGSSVQFVQVPACNTGFGLVSDSDLCNAATEILTTCFVQGATTLRPNEPTIVGVEYGFNSASPARKFAMHGETGSIWGLAWKSKTQEIFSSAFVKQYSGLKAGHDAIFRTVFNGTSYTTSVFANLSALGQNVGTLTTTDVTDCNYGAQVGNIGLGSIVLSPDEKYLYVVNIYNNTLVKIPTSNPTAANTVSYQIPGSGIHAFALKYYNNKIYVGVTVPGDVMSVLAFDPVGGSFSDTGLSIDAGSDWTSSPVVGGAPAFWLTDIDFTDNGDMLLSLSDRIGHMYCNSATNRLDEQKGDLMIAYKNGSSWTLEDRSTNPEFFGDDHWITNPTYHPEITIGSIYAMPGLGSVVATVFDPELNSYSGGLHRYNTASGKKEGSKELYTRETVTLFGKATGFGEIIATCGLPDIEIGNFVWFDKNNNGIQDADETGLGGVEITLLDKDCNIIAATTTDSRGNYLFNKTNVSGGIDADATYFIGIGKVNIDTETGNYLINGEYYSRTVSLVDFTNINSDAKVTACKSGLIEVSVKNTSHNFDIGLRPEGDCGLKISKVVLNPGVVSKTDLIRFQISVLNSGSSALSEVNISDKLPTGYVFDSSLNPGWINESGVLKYSYTSKLIPGQSASTILSLSFDLKANYIQYINEVHVISAKDATGKNIENISSCFLIAEDGVSADAPIVCDLALMHKAEQSQLNYPNRSVNFVTTICNQGTEEAASFQITDYLNAELDFDPSKNPGWVISQDLTQLTYDELRPLASGECRNYALHLSIKDSYTSANIINYAEISNGACTNVKANADIDSTPDTNKENDKGGQPNTANDNKIDDNGTDDEDDHDPATVSLNLYDLSLTKTVKTRRASAGDVVVFDLTIRNNGQAPVSGVTLVDYVPKTTDLVDTTWNSVNGNAVKGISFPGNLLPGQSYTTTCSLKIHTNVKHPAAIYNTAEITEIFDPSGNDVSKIPAGLPEGNEGAGPTISEITADDKSTVYVVLICPAEYEPCSDCRAATTPTNGQFIVQLKIASKADEHWYVESSVGLYDTLSPFPPVAPTPLANGFGLAEVAHEHDGASYYLLKAVHLDRKGFSVRLRNEFGDLETVTAAPTTCFFERLDLTGPQSMCLGGVATYTADSNVPGVNYTWSIDGVVVPGITGDELVQDWTGFAIGAHTVTVAATPGCIAPSELTVVIGEPDNSAIACIGDFNVSLDGNCSVVITPSMMAAGSLNPLSPYVVMLTDAHGNPIPNATLTAEHAGTKVMAKLIESCGGNSCWSTITVEDKMAPTSICSDIVLPCYKLDEYEGPFEGDNCNGPVTNVIVSENITVLSCNEEYVKYIDRVYQATDQFGNKSALCNMRISLERPDFDLIKMPPNYLMSKDSALICNAFAKDEFGHPSPSVTGVPTMAGIPLYPSFSEICNLTAWYKDTDHGLINCTRKITRDWTIYEQWCSDGQISHFKQLIEITDTLAPVIKAIADFTVTTNGHKCEGTVILPAAIVKDSCSNYIQVDVAYPNGFIDDFKNNSTITLPSGEHTITYTAYDACGNSSATSFEVTVEDNTAPTVICKGEVVVGLNSNGEAYLLPSHLNDGSFDGCGIDSMKVARMVVGGLIPDSNFVSSIDFNCADAGRTIMVALRVWDTNGNSNSCMVNVTVQDKHAPKISCPADVTIDCSVVHSGLDLSAYGNAVAIDACGASVRELTPTYALNSCRVGTIVRTFEATDGLGTATCTQTITVENTDYFDPETDVVFPLDYTVTNRCSADELKPESLPSEYGYPQITQSACGLAAATYKDEVYNFVTGACYKIVRKWTVIDWCEMERLGSDYTPYTYQQIIKVNNTVPPFFVGATPKDTTFYTLKGVCDEGEVKLSFVGGDACTPNSKLKWTYKIDLDNDSDIDISNTGSGHIVAINTDLPTGTHKILWSFEDQCGNVTTRSHIVTVRNNDKPTAAGLESIAVSINPMDLTGDGIPDIEMGCITASSLNTSSNSLCCDEPLKFSFSADVNDTIRCFDCLHIGLDNIVELWVHDCNGNTDYIEVHVDVQDNNDSDVCEKICEMNPAVAAITGDLNICRGETTVLTATGGISYLWNTGATTASISVNPNIGSTYTVTVTNRFRCTDDATATVNVSPLPNASISGNNICVGGSTTLTASGGSSYVWNNGQTTAAISVSPSVNTTYTVTVTNASGCSAVASRLVQVSALPIASISGGTSICIGSNTTLTASGGSSYLWSNSATTASITVSPVVNTTYTVTVTNTAGCTDTESIIVTVNGLSINALITGLDTLCSGQSATLTASLSGGNATNYIWSNNATTSSINVTPAATTTYSVTVTDINGCTDTASKKVNIKPLPVVTVTGPNACQGGSTTLTATGGGTYLWLNGATSASITVTPGIPTTYSVTVTGTNGCSAVGSKLVNINPLPSVTINGDLNICINESTTLTASGGISYVWSNNATTASITVSPSVTTTYTVTATDANGCTNTQNTTVNVNGLTINANINGNDSICIGSSSTLTATLSGGTPVSYLWSNNATTSSITVSPSATRTYTVTITDLNGCNGTDNFVLTVLPLPTINIAGDLSICPSESTVLTASGAASYVWSTGATTASTTVTPSATSTYTVTATDAFGCINTASRTVVVNPLPSIDISGDNIICAGTSTVLFASGATTYLWNTGATTTSITVSPAATTTYSVTGTDGNGCANTATEVVTVNANPTPIISGDQMICLGDTATLNVTGGSTYLWSTGETTTSIEVVPNVTTVYSVTATDANGCIGVTSATVVVDPGTLTCSTQNFTAYLNGIGSVTINPMDISTGSVGACANITAEVDPDQFFCNDIGTHVVTLTVTNTNTNQSLSCTAVVTVLDTLVPVLNCPINMTLDCETFNPNAPLSNYGIASVTDNCPNGLTISEIVVSNINDCNVGQITRTFIATDLSGNADTCVQLINVINNDPFGSGDINFPTNVTITNCESTDPSNTGNTTVDTGQFDCADIVISFTDNIDSCVGNFQRTWTVVDSCQLITGTTQGIFTHVQNINIIVEVPVLTGPDTIYIQRDPTTCMASYTGSASSTGCNLVFTNNGIVVPDLDLSGDYPDDTTYVQLISTESCTGTSDTLDVVFIVTGVDMSIICTKTYPELPDVLFIEESVYDHATIVQGCTNGGAQIVASYSNSDINDTLRTYTCADLPNTPIPIVIYFWYVGDPAPFTFCNSLVGLQNQFAPFCTTPPAIISGSVMTEGNQAVPHVEVTLEGSNAPDANTTMNGQYKFPEMQGGGEYNVVPKRDDHPLEGVSTLDLIYIQKHILNSEILSSPYKIIAADVNNDEKVSASDIVQLRKLILGIQDKFTNNTSWRMIDKAYSFPDLKDPFVGSIPEHYFINTLDRNMNIDWVGVKVGDVNNSYITNINNNEAESRNASALLNLTEQTLYQGKNVIPVYAGSDLEMEGFQISLPIKDVNGIFLTSGSIAITEEQYALVNGKLNIAWHQSQSVDVRKGDILFFIHADLKVEDKLSNIMLTVDQKGLRPEVYTSESEVIKLGWRIDRGQTDAFTLYGNTPNPWSNETTINFALPEDGNVSLKIRDITGRLVYTAQSYFAKGDNIFKVSSDALGASGILFYDLTFGKEVKTMKMLNIK